MPAVDVAGGRAIQVLDGAVDDPAEVTAGWERDGARWLHVVDVDRAFRRGDNASLMRRLVSSARVPVQLSGGIEDARSARWALQTGAERVNLASTATADLALVESLVQRHGARVVVGLDLHGEQVVARGTNLRLGALDVVMPRLADTGAHEFLIADVTRDGTRAGVDVGLFSRAAAAVRACVPQARIVLSGGVSSLADLTSMLPVQAHGVWAVVLGSALHHGRFTLEQAQRVVDGDG
ncbi:MAG: HisA/HisF-related TIM barrel protein [Ornithinimicrobium sp.]